MNKTHTHRLCPKSLMDSRNQGMCVLWYSKDNKQRISLTMTLQCPRKFCNLCGALAFLKAILRSRGKRCSWKEPHNPMISFGKTPTCKFSKRSEEKPRSIYSLLVYCWLGVPSSMPWLWRRLIVKRVRRP